MKNFSIISGVALNGVIGDSQTNAIPWHLPKDLQFFKQETLNKTIIMGSRTYLSLGKPLKNRRNVVITRDINNGKFFKDEGVNKIYSSVDDAIKNEEDGFLIIGGQHLYSEALKKEPNELIITIVKINADGDVMFPINGNIFLEDTIHVHNKPYKCSFRSEWMLENGIEFQFTKFNKSF